MRSIASRLVAGTALIVAAGCASTRPAATYEIDHARVAQIERAARAFGTQVIWVNYPTRRVEAGK